MRSRVIAAGRPLRKVVEQGRDFLQCELAFARPLDEREQRPSSSSAATSAEKRRAKHKRLAADLQACFAAVRIGASHNAHDLARAFESERVIALSVEIAGIFEPRDQELPLHPLAAFEAELVLLELAGKSEAAHLRFGRLPVKIPLAATETERTPAPDSSSRQPPLPLFVIATASPLIDSCVVFSPATVVNPGGLAPSPIFSRNALPRSAAIVFSSFIRHSRCRN